MNKILFPITRALTAGDGGRGGGKTAPPPPPPKIKVIEKIKLTVETKIVYILFGIMTYFYYAPKENTKYGFFGTTKSVFCLILPGTFSSKKTK